MKALIMDLSDPRFKADPFPFYARLRAETPVCPLTQPDGRTAWLVTRYEDAAAALKDERLMKDKGRAMSGDQLSRERWMPKSFRPLTRNMLDVDEPDHRRLRALVQKAFTPRRVEEMRGRIQSLADERLAATAANGRLDVIEDYAMPIPTTVIAEMLGVPAADRHRFHRWSSRIVQTDTSRRKVLRAVPSVLAFLRYIRKLVEARREYPRDDLVSALVEAEEAGDRLSADELVAMVFLLLVAGHETTVHLIGNGLLALLDDDRGALRRLAEDPGLIDSAVEELLRYAGPLDTATERYAGEEMTIAGATIPRGALVLVGLASANRDERQFPQPDRLDLAREPNRHLGFGHGVHFCLGAPLARLEGRIAIGTLVRRAPRLRLAVPRPSLRWRGGLVLRGLRVLPVELDR